MRSLSPDWAEELAMQRIASAGIAWEVFLDYDPVFPDVPEPQGEAPPPAEPKRVAPRNGAG